MSARMHELASCTIRADDGATVDGYVRAFAGDVLMIRAEHIVRGFEAGQDVTIEVLDEVRGECLYAGFVTRVGAGGVDVADVELVSTLQKREVARVRVTLPYVGTLHRRARNGSVADETDTADDVRADTAGPGPETDSAAAEGGAESSSGAGASSEGTAPSGPGGAAGAVHPSAGAVHPSGGGPVGVRSGPVRFTLLDISAHGMRVLTQATIPAGTVIRFVFDGATEPFVIDAIVVRAQESRTGTHYGCRFVGLSVRETDALFRYVMQTQGAQRRERLRG